MKNIEDQHKLNFEFIKEHDLKVGDSIVELLPNQTYPKTHIINSINPHYGWVCNEYRQINIENIITFKKEL